MSDLTESQVAMLVVLVEQHESEGVSLHVGPRRIEQPAADIAGFNPRRLVTAVPAHHEENVRHADARALIRAGLAEWHPPIPPISRAIAKRAGTPGSPIRAMIDAREHVTPTPLGRERAAEHKRRSAAARKGAASRRRNAKADKD